MQKVSLLSLRGALCASGLLLMVACTSPGDQESSRSPGVTTEPSTSSTLPEPELPIPADSRERNQRLVRLENACDQWHAAYYQQEYARMESLETLIRTYTRDHFEDIVSDLRHGSPRHKKTMAMALGFSGRRDAIPPLSEALKDQHYEVVLHTLLSIYQLNDPKLASAKDAEVINVDPELILPYLQHPRPEVRSNAALALSRIVGPSTSKSVLLALIGTAEDLDPATRNHAIAALGASRDPEVFPHLVKALSDNVQLVRIRAALGLGRLGNPNAAPYLVEVLERPDEKPDVKKATVRALAVLLNDPNGTSLDPKYWNQKLKPAGS